MKTHMSGMRTNRSVRFHHQRGVEYQKQSKKTFWGLLSLTLMIGLSGALATNLPAARDFFGKATSRQSQTVVQASPPVKSASSDLAAASVLPTQDKQLAKKIAAKLATFPESQEWSVYVQDIESDRSAAVDADATYDPASLYKLFLLAPLESKFPAAKWTNRLQGKTIKYCVDLMLRISDNGCGQAIGGLVNWGYVDSFNESIGFKKTKFGDGKGGVTTAREVGQLLVNLRKGQMLSDKARRQVFDSLYEQKYASGIPAGCSNCRVANKTGDLNGVVHDAGIVTHGKDSYVLVIMSKGGSFDQIAELTRVIESEMYP